MASYSFIILTEIIIVNKQLYKHLPSVHTIGQPWRAAPWVINL